jgi:hypothetical protein
MTRRLAILLLGVLALMVPPATGWTVPVTFAGAWVATDPDDGSRLKLQISGSGAPAKRHVTLVDQFASACGAPATAIGLGTVSGTTLTATLDVRCGGAPFADDVPFVFEAANGTVVNNGVVFTRPGS